MPTEDTEKAVESQHVFLLSWHLLSFNLQFGGYLVISRNSSVPVLQSFFTSHPTTSFGFTSLPIELDWGLLPCLETLSQPGVLEEIPSAQPGKTPPGLGILFSNETWVGTPCTQEEMPAGASGNLAALAISSWPNSITKAHKLNYHWSHISQRETQPYMLHLKGIDSL